MLQNAISLYTFSTFSQFNQLIAGVSSRNWGNTKFTKNFQINQNFKKIISCFNSNPTFTLFEQIHGAKIAIVETKDMGKILPGFDGGVTTLPNLFLAVFVADCFPILVYEPAGKIIGIVHAGWRGVNSGIVENLILTMKKLGANLENILIGIGPGICGKCYEVGNDVASKFKFVTRGNGKLFLDLQKEIVKRLVKLEVRNENIESSQICVYENKDFFSARRERQNLEGEQVALIGLRG